MEAITHWAGNIVSYLVFLTVLTGLLPAHKYEKYIRLFAGCILLLIVLKPLTDGLRLDNVELVDIAHIAHGAAARKELSQMEKPEEIQIPGYVLQEHEND